jgi:hypothetical protein
MTRYTILTLAVIAGLGATALASSSASARSFGTFSHANVSGNVGGNAGKATSHMPMGVAITRFNPSGNSGPVHINPGLGHINPALKEGNGVPQQKLGFFKKPIDIDCVSFKPHCDHDHDHDFDHDHDHDHDWWWWKHHHHTWYWWYGRPYEYGTEYGAPVATMPAATGAVASGPSAPCNCLTKRYLADGSVLFSDLCTKEQAMATPDDLRAQQQGAQAQNQ